LTGILFSLEVSLIPFYDHARLVREPVAAAILTKQTARSGALATILTV